MCKLYVDQVDPVNVQQVDDAQDSNFFPQVITNHKKNKLFFSTVVPCILILSKFYYQLMHRRTALTLKQLMSYIYIYIYIYIYGAPILDVSRSHTTTQHSRQDSPGRVMSSSQRPLPDNTQHSQQTSMPAVGFEPTISAGKRPQTYALDRAATGTGSD